MQVVNSEKIEDSDLYNVTVNMVLKKEGSSAKANTESKPPKKSLELLSVDENSEETKDAVAVPEKPVVKKKPIVIKPKK